MKSTLRRAIQIIAVVVVLLAFVPSGAGGAADYVTVTGSSMSPTLETGDTVMLTRQDHYAVGDIIAYRSQGLGGVVVIEQLFGLPGLGWMLLNGIYQRDYPVVQGSVLFFALVFALTNLLVDLTYAQLDPRIKYG